MCFRIDILTLFPEMFWLLIGTSIPKRAAAKGLVEYKLTNFRDYAVDNRRTVDDSPFGGGPGMVMMCQTVFDTVEAVEKKDSRTPVRILLTPQGELFDQHLAQEFAQK